MATPGSQGHAAQPGAKPEPAGKATATQKLNTTPSTKPKAKAKPLDPPRRGPRSDGADVKAEILKAALEVFTEQGYQDATIKRIAERAGADTKMVHYYFASKANLFAVTMAQVLQGTGLIARLLNASRHGELVGVDYVRQVLTLLETTEMGPVYIGLIRNIGTHRDSQEIMLGFVHVILESFGAPGATRDMRYRASLMGTQMLGLVFARYILKNPVIAEASIEELARDIGPTIDRYLVVDSDLGVV